jgi:hypothetical protein
MVYFFYSDENNMVKEYSDISGERSRIEQAIKKYGYAPEHHFDWYQYCRDAADENIFVESDRGALLTVKSNLGKEYYVFSSPLASPENRALLLLEYLDHVLNIPGVRKVWLELEAPLRHEFLKTLPLHLKARKINYTLTWPIMGLRDLDPEYPGGSYKSMRKEKNKFYREHAVAVHDAKMYEDRAAIRGIIDRWAVARPTNDKVWSARYYNTIENNFAGMDEARVFTVDGKAVGINAGWRIPGSQRFYGGIGIHDYSLEDLGMVLYWEDISWLKNRGYDEVDMGGTWGTAMNFKNKFTPASYYKTFIFSIGKK